MRKRYGQADVLKLRKSLIRGFLTDYRRKKAGVDVKRIKSISIIYKSLGLLCPSDIADHRVDINETGKVKQFLYNRENRKAVA